jgi:YggT family protein
VEFVYFLKQTLNILLDLLTMLILLRVILSWFRHDAQGLMNLLYQVTEPILAPIRRTIPAFGIYDLSPLVALLIIKVARILINTYL